MLLNRSIFLYMLFAILLFTVDMDLLHKQRGGYLCYLYQKAGQGKDVSAGIRYYDYLRRLDPADITTWEDLMNSYLSANEKTKARETILLALKTTPRESKNYPKLLELYKALNEKLFSR